MGVVPVINLNFALFELEQGLVSTVQYILPSAAAAAEEEENNESIILLNI